MSRLLLTALVSAAVLRGAGDVEKAALRLDLVAAKAPKPLAMEFRMRGAEALRERYPDLARKLADQTLADLRSGKDWVVGYGVVQGLAEISPADALSVLPHLVPGYSQIVISALAQSHRTDEAVALYLDLLHRREARPAGSAALMGPMLRDKPQQAAKLFSDILAAIEYPPEPADVPWIVNTAATIAPYAREKAADAIESALKAVSAPEYAAQTTPVIIGAFSAGSRPITTTNTRDTLLLLSAMRLYAVAPDRLTPYRETLSKWDFSGGLQLKSISSKSATPVPAAGESHSLTSSINQRMGQIRGKATDAERADLVREIAADIAKLPPGAARVNSIRSLSNLSTEGDLGKAALSAVADVLASSIRASFPVMTANHEVYPYGDAYLDLARLVRYERVPSSSPDFALDAAIAVLELREHLQQENGFTLTGLDGKTYSLAGLKGRVVLLNFWATWCPPCRREMPDMDKLYREYKAKGLTVLAVSDEDRETVEKFLAKSTYSFPILLDPGRKVHSAYMVEGIPKSFVFDREGHLAALAIDMRTESQFRELLKQAGLE
jgi:peroxiredoxin